MRTIIDVKINNAPLQLDMTEVAAYIANVIRETTGTRVNAHIIENDNINPAELIQAIQPKINHRGGIR